jgi:2',5'-phosphodiesterase
LTFRIFDDDFPVEINPPIAENARLPDSIMSGFMVYPFRINLFFAEKSDSKFEWFVSKETFGEKPSQGVKDWVSATILLS